LTTSSSNARAAGQKHPGTAIQRIDKQRIKSFITVHSLRQLGGQHCELTQTGTMSSTQSAHGLPGLLGDLLPEHVGLATEGYIQPVGIGNGVCGGAHRCKPPASGEAASGVTQEGSSVNDVGFDL
jgi:hypothetical protein